MSAILQLAEGILGHLAGEWLFVTKKGKDGKTEKVINPAALEQIRQIRISKKRKSRVDEGMVEAVVDELETNEQKEWRNWRQKCLTDDQRSDLSYSYAVMFSTITNLSDGSTTKATDALKKSMRSLLTMTRSKRTEEAVAMGFAFSPDGYQTIWEKAAETEAGKKLKEAGEQAKQVLTEAQVGVDGWQQKLDQAEANAKNNLDAKLTAWRNRS